MESDAISLCSESGEQDDKHLQQGSRWFIPAAAFPGNAPQQLCHGLGWLATVREVRKESVIFHCDGDRTRELSESKVKEFLEDCTALNVEPAHAHQVMPQTEPDCCQRNPRCTRGFNHRGHGGHCSLKTPPPSCSQSGSSRKKARKDTRRIHDESTSSELPPAATRPAVRTPGIRLPEVEDEKVGTHIKVYLADEGGVWRTAKILGMMSVLDWSGRPSKGYSIRFDCDGKVYDQVLLDKPHNDPMSFLWEPLGEEDELDRADAGVLPEPPSPRAPQQQPQQRQWPQPSHVPATASSSRKRKRSAHLTSHAQRKASPRVLAAQRPTTEAWLPHDPVSQCVEDAIEAVLARARDEAAAASHDLPVMRKLRTYEWFAGSGRLSFALLAQGCDVMIHDRDPAAVEWAAHSMQPDAKRFSSDEFLSINEGAFYAVPPYDYMHFSIDCSSFTGLSHAGQGRNEGNSFLGDGVRAEDGNQLLYKTTDMIALQLKRKPTFLFTVENPYTGRMKEHPIVQARLEVSRENGGLGATRIVLDYCRFWDGKGERPFHKRTIIWTNSPTLIREFGEHRPPATSSYFLCERSSPCQFFGVLGHRGVHGRTAKESTPFPLLLAWRMAQAITLDLSSERWRSIG